MKYFKSLILDLMQSGKKILKLDFEFFCDLLLYFFSDYTRGFFLLLFGKKIRNIGMSVYCKTGIRDTNKLKLFMNVLFIILPIQNKN